MSSTPKTSQPFQAKVSVAFREWFFSQESFYCAIFVTMLKGGKSLEEIIEDNAEKPEILDATKSNFEDFKALEAFTTYQRNLTFNNESS